MLNDLEFIKINRRLEIMEERLELKTNESKIAMERLGFLLKDLIEI